MTTTSTLLRPISFGLFAFSASLFGGSVLATSPEDFNHVSGRGESAEVSNRRVGFDVPVSDPTGDSGPTLQQFTTAMAVNPITGTICAAHEDTFHGVSQGNGFTGFAQSIDGGATFVDHGAIGSSNLGDPSLAWRQEDGNFYLVTSSGGLSIWRSTDDCQSFTLIGEFVAGSVDDRPQLAVDNNEGGAYYGRLYVHWSNFAQGEISGVYSDDRGLTWSTPVNLSSNTISFHGAWPTVAPNGDVFSAWSVFDDDLISIEAVRSTDGGVTWSPITAPMIGQINPEDAAASEMCFRPALKGRIGYFAVPQLEAGPNGDLHIVYSYDPDGPGDDTVDVFYRRSTDSGASWLPEVRVNDDLTTNDQFFPSLSVGDSNIVSIGFYDRRNDPDNLLYEYYQATSLDGGTSFLDNIKVSDVQSPVFLDPFITDCLHGDYDSHVQHAGLAIMQWSDDRNNNADTFSDSVDLGTDFRVVPEQARVAACIPNDGVVSLRIFQLNGFSEPVTLAEDSWPAGLSGAFATNPVIPPGTSLLTISGTNNLSVGSYPLDIKGTSAPSSIVEEATVTLELFDQIPGLPAQVAPADNATFVPLRPAFSWNATAQAASYTIEIATDIAFTNIVFQSTVEGLTVTPPTALAPATIYYWRLRATNACGETTSSALFSFSTVPEAGACPPEFELETLFSEDFESGAGDWTTGGLSDTWALETGSSQSGITAFQADDVSFVSDQYLISPPYELPSGGDSLSLQFFNRQGIEEAIFNGCFDGAVLEISIDGGDNWIRLESEIEIQPYDDSIPATNQNPLSGSNAWCGTKDWRRFVVDLMAFGGQTAQIRFRLATDNSVGDEGWWIDDVSVTVCTRTGIFTDGFESGDTSRWSTASP